MTIELEIIPTIDKPFSWGELRRALLSADLPPGARQLLGSDPRLLDPTMARSVPLDELLVPTLFLAVEHGGSKALEFDVQTNRDCDTNEQEFLEDYGRNLNESAISTLAAQWRSVGYSFCIQSHPRRHRDEPAIVVALATVIAKLCEGFVVVKHTGVFNKPVGVYEMSEFRSAQPLFSEMP